jgi:hypothetical protein
MRNDAGLAYINCGDWIENCTAVVEHFDGSLEIVAWAMRGEWGGHIERSAPAIQQQRQAAHTNELPQEQPAEAWIDAA